MMPCAWNGDCFLMCFTGGEKADIYLGEGWREQAADTTQGGVYEEQGGGLKE